MMEIGHKKDIKKVAQEVHLYLLASPERMDTQNYSDFRRLFLTWCQKAPDAPVRISLQQEEVKPAEQSEPALTGDARQRKLSEWMAQVKSAKIVNAVPPLSHKQILEEGGWKPKPSEIREPSDVEKAAALNRHIERINNARTALFLEAFPDAEQEEIEAYLTKFKEI